MGIDELIGNSQPWGPAQHAATARLLAAKYTMQQENLIQSQVPESFIHLATQTSYFTTAMTVCPVTPVQQEQEGRQNHGSPALPCPGWILASVPVARAGLAILPIPAHSCWPFGLRLWRRA